VTGVRTRTFSALRGPSVPRGPFPWWSDGLLALAILAISLVHSDRISAAQLALNIALVLPLPWRRRAPVPIFALIAAVAVVQWIVLVPAFADSALLVAFYTVAVASEPRVTAALGVAMELGIVFAATRSVSGSEQWLRAFIGVSGLAVAAGVLGINVRHRRHTLSGLRERAERLELEREQELALARVTERSRIARELHDVVAHNLSVMVALCDGAAYHVQDAPERVSSALEHASRTGRQALSEMRQLLGVLRDAPAVPEFAPQPGIGQIHDLVEQVRAAGVPVSYSVTGQPGGVPAGLELATYRIVQEALTNTMKHAGPGARASVELTCSGERITIEVRDTGTLRRPPRQGGAGLRGMRERAAVYGGELDAGPCEQGGWRVSTSLGDLVTAVR
jgi:signal transduction histidine kinase